MWNPFRRAELEDDELARADERPWATRLAWFVLIGGAGLLLIRCGLATVVEIHGDGMAPTLLSGDHVVLVRGTWGLAAGDLVVYDPAPPEAAPTPPDPAPTLPGPREGPGRPRQDGPRQSLRNTAVVDVEDLELGDQWKAVQRRSGLDEGPPRSLRVGRILAVPGDRIIFGDPAGVLGLAINGRPLTQEIGATLRLAIRGPTDPSAPPARARGTATEAVGDRRYQILLAAPGQAPRWPGIGLPGDTGPVEMQADGYLVIADNRDEGACCDSRALGFVEPARIRGEIVLRLGGRNASHPDVAPDDHGLRWKP